MAKTEIYVCDRCGRELPARDVAVVGDRSIILGSELCATCVDKLREWLKPRK